METYIEIQIKELKEKIEEMIDSEHYDAYELYLIMDELEQLEAEKYNGLRMVE